MNPNQSRAIQIDQHGGPEQLKLVQVSVGEPGPGEIRIRHKAVGLNFIDVYQRSGLYPMAMPLQLGMEAAGVVEAVGEGVSHLQVGDRAAYASQPPGAYCDLRVMPAKCVCKLPDGISFDTGAAMMLKGLTAQYLLKKTLPQGGLNPGDFVLFHAAAGGVGLIASQWARALGVNMIGTVGSDEKGKLALEHGCSHVINYRTENFVERVKEITGGKKLPVVYDSIGKDTWPASLDCLQPLGLMVSFGNSSGPVSGVDLGILAAKGSLFVTRQTLMAYTSSRATMEEMANNVFNMMKDGKLDLAARQTYSLADAAKAHRDLEARNTTGGMILVP